MPPATRANGRGTPEVMGVLNRIDIITSTLGKALGGAAGGFTCAKAEVVDFLRQAPLAAVSLLQFGAADDRLRCLEGSRVGANAGAKRSETLQQNARQLRTALEGAGFKLKPGMSPILPVMLGEATLASKMAEKLLERGIYVIGFSYPVVPLGHARIRIQVSAAHTTEQIQQAADAFIAVGKELGVIS